MFQSSKQQKVVACELEDPVARTTSPELRRDVLPALITTTPWPRTVTTSLALYAIILDRSSSDARLMKQLNGTWFVPELAGKVSLAESKMPRVWKASSHTIATVVCGRISMQMDQ